MDEVMQIQNVFINVSKGQIANSEDLKKAFGKTDVNEIVKEVPPIDPTFLAFAESTLTDPALCQIVGFRAAIRSSRKASFKSEKRNVLTSWKICGKK